jgi:hypothetical protein
MPLFLLEGLLWLYWKRLYWQYKRPSVGMRCNQEHAHDMRVVRFGSGAYWRE